MLPVKPLIKRSHHIILSPDGDLCIGELPGSAKIIKNPPQWVVEALKKMDGRHTLPRIVKELSGAGHAIGENEIKALIERLQGFNLLEVNDYHSAVLSTVETERYDRQILQYAVRSTSPSSSVEYQEKLKTATVVIFGMGGWGTWCGLQLAMNGVGTIRMIDGDVVELSNLNRQVLYDNSSIGRPKVEAASDSIARINPHVHCETFFEFASRDIDKLRAQITGASAVLIAWASLGHFRKNTVEEMIHRLACEQGIPVMELGGDPIEISAGPIYPHRHGINYYESDHVKNLNGFYSENEKISNLQKARMKHSFSNGSREVNAWQSSPSLSVMSGIVCDQLIKYITGYDDVHLVGRRVYMSMDNFATREVQLFDASPASQARTA